MDFIYYKQKQENIRKVILNIDRVRQECNWEPKVDFKSGIRLNKLWIEEFLYSENNKPCPTYTEVGHGLLFYFFLYYPKVLMFPPKTIGL